MKVTAYSSISVLPALKALNLSANVRFFAHDQMMLAVLQLTHGTDIDSERLYPLEMIEHDGKPFAVVRGITNSPFNDKYREHGMEDFIDSLILRSLPSGESFGLRKMGLMPQLIFEVGDDNVIAFSEHNDKTLNDFAQRRVALGNMRGEADVERFDPDEVGLDDPRVEAIIDTHYLLAAYDMHLEGYMFQAVNRDAEVHDGSHVVEVQPTDNFFPSLTFEYGAAKYVALLDDDILARARQYATEGVPVQHRWVQEAVLMDYLSLAMLEPNVTYQARVLTQFEESLHFGDMVTFTLHPEDNDSYRVEVVSPTGEVFQLGDHIFSDWTHSFFAAEGEARKIITSHGIPARNLLQLHSAL